MPRGSGVVLATAEWLCDAYGNGNGDVHEFIDDARDLVEYLRSHQIIVRRDKQPKTGVWKRP